MNGRTLRTTGLTLIEMTLVIATMAIMAGLAVPAMRMLVKSFQSEGGTISMVNAALNSARGMAVSRQRYVGVRFQKLCTSTNPADPLKGLMDAPQYMIFIMHDPAPKPPGTDLANGFRAVEGLEPVKLPASMGMIDLSLIQVGANGNNAIIDGNIDEPRELCDVTTFSIVFSPAGKLVVQPVRTRNHDGQYRPNNSTGSTSTSMDDVFNSAENICLFRQGMFLQDDYSPRKNRSGNGQSDILDYGLGEESSCTSFAIYETPLLRVAYDKKMAWTDYLGRLAARAFYVSPYTGNLISPD